MKDEDGNTHYATIHEPEQLEEILKLFPQPTSVRVKLINISYPSLQEQLDEFTEILSMNYEECPIKKLTVRLTDVEGYLENPTNNEILRIYTWQARDLLKSEQRKMDIVQAYWQFGNNGIGLEGSGLIFHCEDISFIPELDKIKECAEKMHLFPFDYCVKMAKLRQETAEPTK